MKNFTETLKLIYNNALQEDVGVGDFSTLSCIDINAKGKAKLIIKQDCIIAGIDVAKHFFAWKEPNCIFTRLKKDGEQTTYGEIAFEIEASVHTILQLERLVLNCMQRMSGIATLTKTYSEKIAAYKTKILDTRKTTPNFRLLEKEAVRIGGGCNHRMGLYDMIMLKDNHIDYCGGLEKAIDKAYSYCQQNKLNINIEVETRTIDDVKKIIAVGKNKVTRIMLDNYSPEKITEALQLINNNFETEASGGINLDNIIDYAKTGVDYISIGALIHQAKSVDLSLKAVISK